MSGIRDAVAAVCLAGLIALVVTVVYQHRRIGTLQEQADAASALVAGYKARDTAAATLNKTKDKTDARVNEVLSAHDDWASTPVPDDVADLLRKH